MPVLRDPVLVKIYGPNRELRTVPRGTVASINYTDDKKGGLTTATVETHVNADALPTVQTGDKIQIWYLNENGVKYDMRYRGKISRRGLNQDNNTTLTLETEGKGTEVGRTVLYRQYLLAGPPDVSDLYAKITEDVLKEYPELVVQSERIGFEYGSVEAFNQSFASVMDTLLTQAGNRSGWGVRLFDTGLVDDYGIPIYQDTLELNRVPEPSDLPEQSITVPSPTVTSVETERDASNVRNIIFLRGGPPKLPNLVPNADFRLIQFADESFNNLLKNPSLESKYNNSFFGGGGKTLPEWTLANGASGKSTGLSEGPAYNGDWVVELDNPGENVSQGNSAASIPNGTNMEFGIYSRRESGSGNSNLQLSVEWYANSSESQQIQNDSDTFLIQTANWDRYYVHSVKPTGATNWRVRANCVTPSVLVDSASFFAYDSVTSRGWTINKDSDANNVVIVQQSWAQDKDTRRSSYAPLIAITSQDQNGKDARFEPTDAIEVGPNKAMRLLVDLRSPLTANGQRYKNGKFYIEVQGYTSDGGKATVTYISGSAQGGVTSVDQIDSHSPNWLRGLVPAGTGFTDWGQAGFAFTTAQNLATVRVRLTFRGNATYNPSELAARGLPSTENNVSRILVGSFSLRDAAAPKAIASADVVGNPPYPDQYEFIPDGPYQARLTVKDVMPTDSDEYKSIETYGKRPYVEEQDGITDLATFRDWARGYFSTYATEIISGRITQVGDQRQLKPTSGIRLNGPRGVLLLSRTVGVETTEYTYDGTHSREIQWGDDRDDVYVLLQELLAKEKAASGTGAGNGYYGSSGSSSGGNVGGNTGSGGTIYWGDSPRTADDDTRHDDYTPADGPHILAQEREDWHSLTVTIDAGTF